MKERSATLSTNDKALQEAQAQILASGRFRAWKPAEESERPLTRETFEVSDSMAEERHFTPNELGELWGVSAETIRITFRDESGVLRLQQPTKGKRAYVLIRIPESVAERVHKRLSAVPA